MGLKGYYVCPGNDKLPNSYSAAIISGGDDIDPKHYGVAGAAGAIYDSERDNLELNVIKLALEKNIPLFGICRGAQLINIACGGTLHTDLRPLRKNTPNRNSIFAVKYANLKEDSLVAKILEHTRVKVNSLHHQAVDKPGKGLKVVAADADDFTQAIEGTGKSYIVGVQWHPEYMPYSTVQTRLFTSIKHAISKA